MRFIKSLLARSGILPTRFTAASSALSPGLADGLAPSHHAGQRYAGAYGQAAKRAFDVGAALVLLLLLSPLMLTVALLVMRDGGPCVFGHTRVGMGGRKFSCLKFRSMVRDADAVLKELLASDPVARAEWEKDFKLRNDVRVTALGRFIRKTSIDELPQLWNVVRGDMSLVGPRPVVEKELERYGESASYYLRVLPGITGLWQVSGRNDADYDKRVTLDVAYVRNWTFAGDIVILFKTIGVVIHGRGAY
ncbi:sugar transferase [Cupriavidus pauculus]|uniref:UDP-phosphate galactose phosphotransferase n=1 Tax=Cupriavidus pauculus TaxID=82633 RepID=A0A2N5C5G1_9BURK|nr:UDP-phosphate galactose phosphotransferase [Cupriavidus pauculus]